jgi:hypothetical protein
LIAMPRWSIAIASRRVPSSSTWTSLTAHSCRGRYGERIGH